MSDIRSDSYHEMKALLKERLDSLHDDYVEDADDNESGLKKWGKRAAKTALGAGLAVGAAYGGRKGLSALARKNPGNATIQKANRAVRRVAARGRMARRQMFGGPVMRGPAPNKP